jgi:L-threonylcarbamoyladenylate synthase
LLRPGGLPREEIERVLGHPLADAPSSEALGGTPAAPGMLASHYAPKALLRLNATEARPGEALLAFGHIDNAPNGTLNLSPRGDLVEAAANLFSHLRALDRGGAKVIAVMPVPDDGLGEAINDRLGRAAAPRM